MAFAKGAAAGSTASGAVGAGIAVNEINGAILASVTASTVTSAKDVNVTATAKPQDNGASIDAMALAGASATALGGGNGFAAALAGAAAGTFNAIERSVTATIESNSTVIAGRDLNVNASDETSITADSGGVAIAVGFAPGQGAGVGLAIGASVSVNRIGDESSLSTKGQIVARIDHSHVDADRHVNVHATSSNAIDTLSIGGAGGSGNGAGGAGVSLAGAGSGSYAKIRRAITAEITGQSDIDAVGSIDVQAADQSTIRASSIGASISVATSGASTGFSGSIGVSISENTIDNAVKSRVDHSTIDAGELNVHATSTGMPSMTLDNNVVDASDLDNASQSQTDKQETPSHDEYTEDKSDDAAILDRLYRQVTGIGNASYPIGFVPNVTLSTIGTQVIPDPDDATKTVRVGTSWLFIDQLMGKAYVIEKSGSSLVVKDSSIAALAVAASVSVGVGASNGLSLSGGGASTNNTVTTTVDSLVQSSTITTAGGAGTSGDLDVSAVNASGIVSTVIAASLAVGAGGSGVGGGASIGAAIAKNSVGFSGGTRDASTANALIDDSSLAITGDLTNVAVNNTRISATVVAASAAISGGNNGIGLAGAGASVENKIALDTTAKLSHIADGDLTAHDVTVQAIDSASIDALAGAAALSVAAAGSSAGTLSIGVGLAKNIIDSNTFASIDQVVAQTVATVPITVSPAVGAIPADIRNIQVRDLAVHDLKVSTQSSGSIDSTAFAATLAASFAGSSAFAFAGAGAEATNQITGSTEASMVNSRIIAAGAVDITSENTADIHALILSVAVSLAGGSSAAVGAAIGVSLARNTIGYDADSNLVIDHPAGSPSSIQIQTGETVQVPSGPGAGDVYEYLGSATLPNANTGSGSTWLANLDFNDQSLWRRVDLKMARSTTKAYMQNSALISGGELTVEADSKAEIHAEVLAASVAIAAAGTGAIGASGAGVGAHNRIAMDVGSWIHGDDDDLATQPAVASYRGPDGQIYYFGSDNEIAELLLNDLDSNFAGSGAPGIHVRSVDVSAQDESTIDSYAGAVSVAAAVSGTVSGAIAVGATVATNKIDNLVHADLMHLDTGLFTTGSTDVSMTPSTTTVDGNATTLFDYAKTAERRGDIKVSANENAQIDSVAYAAALSAAFGSVFSERSQAQAHRRSIRSTTWSMRISPTRSPPRLAA